MIIKTQSELDNLCTALAGKPYIALDTEFLRDKTYYSRLCLLQVAANGVKAVALDPIETQLDWTGFMALMDNPAVVKVFHAARQDLEIFHDLYKRLPHPIFDTQVAAMVLGYGDQIAYNALVRDLTGQELEKSAQFTDWSRRPLSEKQLSYALDDVTYLCQIYEKLKLQLEQKDRLHWVKEEMEYLTSPTTYESHPENAWKRIKLRNPKPEALAILKALAEWREREAQARNIPRGRFIKDEAIADLAMYKPKDMDSLLHVRTLPSDVAKGKLGPVLLKIIAQARAGDPASWPKVEAGEPFPKRAQATLEMLKMLLRINASDNDVAAKLIATSEELEQLAVEDAPDVPAVHGWRREIFGEEALALKGGQIALKLHKGKIVKALVDENPPVC